MNRQRCLTEMPGVLASTMKAVICFFRSLPSTIRSGVRAITTNRSARVPLVHQSFSPEIAPGVPIGAGRGRGRHVGRVGPGVHLGQRKGRDGALGDLREEPLLLLVRAEQLERLRHADGLRGRKQRAERPALGRHQLHRAHVAHLRKPEPAVFLGNLDPEGAEFAQLLDVRLGDVPGAVHEVGIVSVVEKFLELGQPRRALRLRRRILDGVRVHQREVEAPEKQLLDEAGVLPLGLARVLGNGPGLEFRGDVRLGGHEKVKGEG